MLPKMFGLPLKEMLHGTIHSAPTLLRDCFKWLQHCSNIATLCCAKNRRYESSRVTSPLEWMELRRTQSVFSVITRVLSSAINLCKTSAPEQERFDFRLQAWNSPVPPNLWVLPFHLDQYLLSILALMVHLFSLLVRWGCRLERVGTSSPYRTTPI